MIKITGLTYTNNNLKLLNDININLNDGEIIGIIGESGSGKTLFLKALAGLLKNYSGEIFLNNISLDSIPAKDIPKHIASIFSNAPQDIIDDTVFNFLLQSRKSFKKLLNPFTDFDIQTTEEYINLFNLNEFRDTKVLSLSDGIFKKVQLAFPFIKIADLLLLDNPTAILDLHSITLLQKTILKYMMNGNKIIVIACNDLNFIFQTADRILIMKDGRIETEENPNLIDAQMITKYFKTEVLISKNIYNGKPVVHQFLKTAG